MIETQVRMMMYTIRRTQVARFRLTPSISKMSKEQEEAIKTSIRSMVAVKYRGILRLQCRIWIRLWQENKPMMECFSIRGLELVFVALAAALSTCPTLLMSSMCFKACHSMGKNRLSMLEGQNSRVMQISIAATTRATTRAFQAVRWI